MAYYSLPQTRPPEPQVPRRVENNRARRSQDLVQEQATQAERYNQVQQQQAEMQRQQQLGGILQGLLQSGVFAPPAPMAPMTGGLPGLGAPQQRPMGGLPGFADGGDVFTGGGWEFGETEEEKYERFLAEQEALKAVVPPPTPAEVYTAQAQQVFKENPELVQVRAGEMQANNADANLAQIRSMREEADKYKGPEPQQTQIGRENIVAPPESPRAQLLGQTQLPNETVPTLPQDYKEDPKETIAKILAGPAQVYEGLNIDIPYVSPAVRAVSPYIEEVASRVMPGHEMAASLLGLPSPGRSAVQNTLGSGGALDLGLLLAPGVGEVPIDDLIRYGARSAGGQALRGALTPDSALMRGLRGGEEGMARLPGGGDVPPVRPGGPDVEPSPFLRPGGLDELLEARARQAEQAAQATQGPNNPLLTRQAAQSEGQLLGYLRAQDQLAEQLRNAVGGENALRQMQAGNPSLSALPALPERTLSTPPPGEVIPRVVPPGQGLGQGQLIQPDLRPPQTQTWQPGPQGGFEGAQRVLEGLPPPATTMPTPPPGALPGQFGLPTPPGVIPPAQGVLGQPGQGGLPGISNLPMQPSAGQGSFPGMPAAGPGAMPPPPGALPGQAGLPTPPGPTSQIGLPTAGAPGMAGGRQVLNPVEGGNAARISDLMRQAQASAPPPAALPVPPRAEAPTPPPTPPPAQLPSQRLPPETLAKRVAGPLPAANDVSRLTFPEKQEQARMLGVDLDEEALIKGTPLTRSLENAKLQKATDEFLAPPGSNPADQLHQKLQEQAASQAAAGGAPPVGALPPPPPASVIPPGTEPPGGWPKGIDTPEKQSAARLIADALYSSLGMDIGTIMRNDVLNMFNLANVPQSMKVIEYAGRMFTSRNEAIKVLDELDALKLATDKAVGKNVKIALPEIPGIREAKGYTNVESNQSTLMGKIPVAGALYNATGRANNGIIYARRILQYAEFVDNLPNRRFVIGLGEKANTPAAKGAVVQSYMRQQQVLAGRANLGSGALQDVLSKTGPLFTSLRFMMSVPERIPYLLPVNRIAQGHWEIMGPQWREAVKAHAGFAGALALTLGAAQTAGLDVDWDKGSIKALGNTYNLTGGLDRYWNTIQKMADGDWMAGADFLRGRVGPLPQVVVQVLQETGAGRATGIEPFLDYMRADGFYNRGFLGTGTPADRIAGYIAPLWMSEVAKAYKAAQGRGDNPLISAAAAAPGAFFGAGMKSSTAGPLTQRRAETKGDPSLPEVIRDEEYKDVGPKAQDAKDKVAEAKDPEGFKKDQAEQRKNEDPVWTQNRETREKITQELEQRKTETYDLLRAGKIDGVQMRELKEAAESDARNRNEKASNDPAFKKALDKLEKNEVNKALSAWYQIPKDFTNSKGKVDWDKTQAAQAKFLDAVHAKDPKTANLLAYEINTKTPTNNPLDKMMAGFQPVLDKYYPDGQKLTATQKADMRRANSGEDAILAFLGYGKTVSTDGPKKLEQLRQGLPSGNATAASGGTRGNSAPVPSAAPSFSPSPAAAAAAPAPAGNFVFPVQGYSGKVNTHWDTGEKGGTDLFAARGTPVLAMDGGKVISVGTTGLGGNNVTIRGNDGRDYYYAHGDRAPAVKVGETIPTGHFLFGVGDSGNAQGKGTHLHLGIGYGINNGSGPQGGSGKNFDAVSHLNAALGGGGGGGGGVRGMSAPMPVPAAAPANTTDLRAYGSSAAQRNGIDPAMFQKLIMHESSWNPDAVNKTSGAAGLGQMLPSTAKGYGVTTEQLRSDPNLALDLSARMLGDAAKQYGGDQRKAVASYFAGSGTLKDAVDARTSDWLKELDRIFVERYPGQGTVSAYLRSVGL